MEIPIEKTYFEELPGDLRKFFEKEYPWIPIELPYEQLVKYTEIISKIPDFWLFKAAYDVNEDPKNPLFIEFFNNYPDRNERQKYIRVLAYDGKMVPRISEKGWNGTGTIVNVPELCRRGLKNPKIMEDFFFLSGNVVSSDIKYIVETLCKNGKIEILSRFLRESRQYRFGRLPENFSEYDNFLYYGASIPQLEELLSAVQAYSTGSSKNVEKFNGELRQYLADLISIRKFMNRNEYQELMKMDNESFITVLELAIIENNQEFLKFAKNRDFTVYTGESVHRYARIQGYTFMENLSELAKLAPFSYYPIDLIAQKDSVELLIFFLENIATKDRENFLQEVKSRGFYDSLLYNYIDVEPRKHSMQEIERRIYLDFAGLATIYENLSPKEQDKFFDLSMLQNKVSEEIIRSLHGKHL